MASGQSLSTRGFSRDRTATFASIRQREHVHKHSFVDERDSARLLGAEAGGNGFSDGLSGVDAVTASVAPAWVDTQEEIRTDMAIIKDKMGELTRIHKTALKPTFDDTGDSAQQMIEVMTREITQHFRKAERKLKSLAAQSNAKIRGLLKMYNNPSRQNCKRCPRILESNRRGTCRGFENSRR